MSAPDTDISAVLKLAGLDFYCSAFSSFGYCSKKMCFCILFSWIFTFGIHQNNLDVENECRISINIINFVSRFSFLYSAYFLPDIDLKCAVKSLS